MATLDWPTTAAFQGAGFELGVDVAEASVTGFYTGTRWRRSSLADRMTCVVTLPPCSYTQAAEREAFLFALRSAGDWVRLGMRHRPVPRGTTNTSGVTVLTTTAAGASSVSLTGMGASKTILAGDLFQIGNQLHMTGYAGATANGSGQATVPLSLPLPKGVSAAAAVTLSSPTGLWELDGDSISTEYTTSQVQGGVVIPLRQVVS